MIDNNYGHNIYQSMSNVLRLYEDSAFLLREIDALIGKNGFNPYGGRGSDVFGHGGSRSYYNSKDWLPHYIQRCWNIGEALIGVRIFFYNYWNGEYMNEERPYIFFTLLKGEGDLNFAFRESFCFATHPDEPLKINYSNIGNTHQIIDDNLKIDAKYVIEYLEEIQNIKSVEKILNRIDVIELMNENSKNNRNK